MKRVLLFLFALALADQVDTQTFNVLGPEIADHFHVGVGVIGAIELLMIVVVPFVSVAEMTAMPPQSRGVRGNPILATPVEAVNGTGGGIGCSKSGLRSAGSPKFVHCPG